MFYNYRQCDADFLRFLKNRNLLSKEYCQTHKSQNKPRLLEEQIHTPVNIQPLPEPILTEETLKCVFDQFILKK